MNTERFRVINGGLSETAQTSSKKFMSAFITNTRLMGVVGMYIHWELPENTTKKDFHQFFYFDAEEYGFDTYKSVVGTDPDKLQEIENSLIGGLGGEKIEITMNEAIYTVQEYAKLNERDHLEFPENREEYEFLLEQNVNLTQPEVYVLMKKQSVPIGGCFELVNYFLMRCFGKDYTAASFLSTNKIENDIFPEFKAATFYKNNISFTSQTGVFTCESLIEFDDAYHIVLTKVSTNGLYVNNVEKISSMKITPQEAAMQLMRSEFISVYEIMEPLDITRDMTQLSKTAMITPHETGKLFMLFNPNNAHVARQNYRLNEDVLGMYYVTNTNQLLAGAYSLKEIQVLEKDIARSPIGKNLIQISKYEFIEPVLYDFVKSGFDDFDTFVEAIKK